MILEEIISYLLNCDLCDLSDEWILSYHNHPILFNCPLLVRIELS